MGRGDDAHIGADGFRSAEALEGLLLKHSQQFRLRRERDVPDLVEKDRSPVALLELADASPVGPGERALLVPEQLALEQ